MKLRVLKSYWKYNLGRNILLLLLSFLEVFGILWLITQISSYYFSTTNNYLKPYWYLFLIVGLIWGLYKSWPKLKISHCLINRDVIIEICISNIFKQKGSYIIGSNTTFDTDTSKIISPESIQGQFTNLYYDKIEHLDKDISDELNDYQYSVLQDGRKGKVNSYPLGTVVKIHSKNQTAYLLAIAELNKHGTASGTFENLKTALSNLWEFIGNRGDLGSLVIPILGSGPTRLQNRRDEIIREIIQSFIAANAEKKFTNKLIIVISPKDYSESEYKLDLLKLDKYLAHLCEYTEFKKNQDVGVGQPIS